MKELDTNGIYICDNLGKLFALSTKEDYSSPIFLRRFLHSDVIEKFEKHQSAFITPFTDELIEDINNQFGKSEYGTIKYNIDAMYWLGYVYGYISYTRDCKIRILLKVFNPNDLIKYYPSYHSQSNEWVIDTLLKQYNLTENFFDNNWRFLQTLMKYSKIYNLNRFHKDDEQ